MKLTDILREIQSGIIKIRRGESYKDYFLGEPRDVYRVGRSLDDIEAVGDWFWFTSTKEVAQQFGDVKYKLQPKYLRGNKILDLRDKGRGWSAEEKQKFLDYADDKGYDTVIMWDDDVSGKNYHQSFIVKNRSQILDTI